MQTPDHKNVASLIQNRTPEARAIERRMLMSACLSGAIVLLLQDKESYYLSHLAAVTGGLLTTAVASNVIGQYIKKLHIETLAVLHPDRLKMILRQVRNQFEELIPEANELEREMFPREIKE